MTASELSETKSNMSTNKSDSFIKIKDVQFNNTAPNQTSQSYLMIGNSHQTENFTCKIAISTFLIYPFSTKFISKETNIPIRAYVRIPISFKPKNEGSYEQNITIKLNDIDFRYMLKGKCVALV